MDFFLKKIETLVRRDKLTESKAKTVNKHTKLDSFERAWWEWSRQRQAKKTVLSVTINSHLFWLSVEIEVSAPHFIFACFYVHILNAFVIDKMKLSRRKIKFLQSISLFQARSFAAIAFFFFLNLDSCYRNIFEV